MDPIIETILTSLTILDDIVIPEETVRRRQVAQLLNKKIEQLGPMSYNEKMVGASFWILVLLWFFRFVRIIKVVPRGLTKPISCLYF